ncbi:MAG: ribosome biogenesis factor YjgA [Pseudomonadota bacterium]
MITSDAQDDAAMSEHSAQDAQTSKTQRKKDAQALQEVGKRLAALKPDVLASFELPDTLEHAINEYNRFRSNEARRRQLQFIGKQMRKVDAEPILERLDILDGHAASAQYEQHLVENWRGRLIAENAALTDFIDDYPNCDRQQLRQLIKKARTEAHDAGSHTQHATTLFRYLREIVRS